LLTSFVVVGVVVEEEEEEGKSLTHSRK